MAADTGEKTEPATPRRRREARSKGQVARSQDLTAAVLLFAGFVGLGLLGPALGRSLLLFIQTALTSSAPQHIDNVLPFSGAVVVELCVRLGPLLLIMFLAVLAAAYVQVGNLLTLQPLMPSLNKINPISGMKRLFSVQSVARAVGGVGKLLAVGLVGYLVLAGTAAAIIYAVTLESQDVLRLGASLLMRLSLWLSAAMLILALLDLAWQRYKHERDLRMSKEEVKDELRSMEGDPKIKGRRRQLQMQLAMQRLRKEVPAADVVVTNPTHYAVAVRYAGETMIAPKVVAKGADYMALRIRQIAREFGIPTVERKALARALYETVEVGAYVPERFYQAIAEILAYVYDLTGRSPLGIEQAGRSPAGIS